MRKHMYTSIIAFIALIAATSGVCSVSTGIVPGTPQTVWYESDVDGSSQAYAVYVPRVAPGPDGYPAVFHTHGYGWHVSTGFSEWQREWARTRGWVLINLNARGPQFYEGIGEVATIEVVEDASSRFNLDRDRLYITGASMGGTGAFRHGVRHPYIFAAAVGVDGWTDYRLWHHHWYARKDARDDIEEFRRPFLESCSPLYWAQRARWGAVRMVVDGRDTTVWPDNGILLHAALSDLSYYTDGKYDVDMTLNYEKGHGGGHDLRSAYRFFEGRQRIRHPDSFHCRTYLLKHGRMYWSTIEGFKQFGLPASLVADVDEATISLRTENVSRFSLHLPASPAAEYDRIHVYADGLPVYHGAPDGADEGTVTAEAIDNNRGETVAWALVPHERTTLHRTAEVSGPIGEVFARPFMVVYGTLGSREMTEMHRREARDFASGWNSFMIREGATHGQVVRAYPEDVVSDKAMRDHGLIVFGTKETSRLLNRAYRKGDIPVVVGEDYVTVQDLGGERTYYGDSYGCFLAYPNPLADNRQYLLAARGQWYTKPEGKNPAGLEYDMEKLPWAYPDYVVFNTDQSRLPHVMNVNNKPPVTCYEAAYFCEAGFFDSRWRPDRAATLDRALKQHHDIEFIHVHRISTSAGSVRVQITDASGNGVGDARVTVTWPKGHRSLSGLTDSEGWVELKTPAGCRSENAHVIGLMATGAVYDFYSDRVRRADQADVAVWLSPPEVVSTLGHTTAFEIGACVENLRPDEAPITILPQTQPAGSRWIPEKQLIQSEGTETVSRSFQWHPQTLPAGRYDLTFRAAVRGKSAMAPPAVERTISVHAGVPRQTGLFVDEMRAEDIVSTQPLQITCQISATSEEHESIRLYCSIIPSGRDRGELEGRTRYLQPQEVVVDPMGNAAVGWQVPETDGLPPGDYEAVVYAPNAPALTHRQGFTVRMP